MTPFMVLAMVVALLEKQRARSFSDRLNDALTPIFEANEGYATDVLEILAAAGFPASYLEALRGELEDGLLNDGREELPHWHRWTMYVVDDRAAPLHSGRRAQQALQLEADLMRAFQRAGMTFSWANQATTDLVEAFLHQDLEPRWLTHSAWGIERARVQELLEAHGISRESARAATDLSLEDLQLVQPGSPELDRLRAQP